VGSIDELLSDEPAWPLVGEWLATATNHVRVVPVERAQGERTLQLLRVTTRAPLGALALETAGLLIDHGWLRVLGGEGGELRWGLASWNGLAGPPTRIEGALIVAHDVVGGFFAVNGGVFAGNEGSVFYFAPDTLDWLDTEMGYSELIRWVCAGDLAGFYADLRWPGWEAEVPQARADQGYHLWPPPFAEQGKRGEAVSRRLVPIEELWDWYQDCARQLAELPEGAPFRLRLTD
jgi:hypothetical protein